MPTLVWSDELALTHTEIDATHQEFVELLTAAEHAVAESPEAGLAAYQALVDHTVGHFGQEDRWMLATGFTADNCHSFQHQQVLELMHEVARLARDKQDFGPLGRVLPELGKWFVVHAQSMDAALASHLDQTGYQPATGTFGEPQGARAPISGCGSSSCTPPAQEAPAEPATAAA